MGRVPLVSVAPRLYGVNPGESRKPRLLEYCFHTVSTLRSELEQDFKSTVASATSPAAKGFSAKAQFTLVLTDLTEDGFCLFCFVFYLMAKRIRAIIW